MLLILLACDAGEADSKTTETGDSVTDTAETGETGTTGTTGSTGDTTDTTDTTVDTTETAETGDTSTDTGPPDIDDGGPATAADCTANWTQPTDAGEMVGVATYDASGYKATEIVDWPDGSSDEYTWDYDSNGCVTTYFYASTSPEGARMSQLVTYTCNPEGFQTGAIVETHAPSDSGMSSDVYSVRYENLVSGTGVLISTSVYWIVDEVESLKEILSYYYDETTGLLSRDTEDTDADGTVDVEHAWGYDAMERVTSYTTDIGDDGTLDSADRYVWYGDSTREYRRTTTDPSSGEVTSERTWTWTCP